MPVLSALVAVTDQWVFQAELPRLREHFAVSASHLKERAGTDVTTRRFYRVGGDSRIAGFMLAAATAALLLMGTGPIAYIRGSRAFVRPVSR